MKNERAEALLIRWSGAAEWETQAGHKRRRILVNQR